MKKPASFASQKRDVHAALMSMFSNTNVRRCATKEALMEIKKACDDLIDGLEDDENNGVKEDNA